jgi:MoxR-like ATPase
MSCYGEVLDSHQLADTLEFVFQTNLANETRTGERPTPICIWGNHGLGKTAAVIEFARARQWRLAYCAPAQFEEIGDLHGLPMKVDPDPSKYGDEYTAYLPPEWVPREEGPGILLLDDLNRADDRILRGLMQLLQNFELFSWSLPRKWQIVCTANPEGGDYSVTPMDDAVLTRMLHVTLRFDAKAWAGWARSAGVDQRGIDFVLTYPESVTGKRTTPRSITQVLSHLQHIADWKNDLPRVLILARSGLDEATVAAFTAYVMDDLAHLVSASQILEATSFDEVKPKIVEAATGRNGTVRVDRLSAILTRVVIELASQGYEKPSEQTKKNVVALLKLPQIPADLRFMAHRDIVALPGGRPSVVHDPELARLVLATV